MMSKIIHYKRDFSKWSIVTIILSLLLTVPLFAIVVYLFAGVGEMWDHIVDHFLFDYVSNSIILIVGAGLLTLLLGVSSAWIVSQYDFQGRKVINALLYLPLAIPSYIVAYCYVGLFDHDGTVTSIWKAIGLPDKIEMMNPVGLIWVLSFSLYPYVYAGTKVMFSSLPKGIQESATLLGASRRRYFYTIALPLASPAIFGGLFLVFMEVLNDYGAAKYYGVNTFTTGIFRSWTMLEDMQSSIYLSALLVVVVFLLTGLVVWRRGRKSFVVNNARSLDKDTNRVYLRGASKALCYWVLAVPILFGFILPVIQLIKWSLLSYNRSGDMALGHMAMSSVVLAIIAAFLVVLASMILIYVSRWNTIRKLDFFKRIATIGYVVPGAIIGIGIIRSSQTVVDFFSDYLGLEVGYLFYGSAVILVYGYIFRFLSVAYNPLEANSLKIGKNISESSYLLGVNKIKTFLRIELPLMKPAIFSSFLLVFIDVLKELPLTLILKPYKLQTLAISAYTYADDERVSEAALPALVLIVIIVVVMILVHYIRKLSKAMT